MLSPTILILTPAYLSVECRGQAEEVVVEDEDDDDDDDDDDDKDDDELDGELLRSGIVCLALFRLMIRM